ncbi:MAG: hypothetical protein KGI63_00475, partial [Xanthomonadaceae bacterium]|nr:hypothetical protein [Xanthomonadaceae bacterium]
MAAIARDRYRVLILIFLIAAILALVVLYPLPPVIDYPNHLARFWLIEGGVHVHPVDKFYFEDWRHVGSGIGIDLFAKAAAGLIPPFTVGSILLMLSMLLPPLGAMALNA